MILPAIKEPQRLTIGCLVRFPIGPGTFCSGNFLGILEYHVPAARYTHGKVSLAEEALRH